MKKSWTVGTRGSRLALKQAELTIETLKKIYRDHEFSIKIIKTKGDAFLNKPLHLVGGKGLFVKEIEEALIRKEIDMAVHSMKDLPSEIEDGLVVAAVLEREDPRDVFISYTYDRMRDLGKNAKVGTSSIRRKSQILHFNRNVEIINLRGNVDTRIRKLTDRNIDAIVLAYAGVKRMGFEGYIKEIIPLEVMVPPSGQGAIGVEIRDEEETIELLGPVNHINSFQEISMERKLQAAIGGGCQTPLGINAKIMDGRITLHIALGGENGELFIKERLTGNVNDPDEVIDRALKLVTGI